MREKIEQQLPLSAFTLEELIGPYQTRDDIDKLVLGFNAILTNSQLRDEILTVLQASCHFSEDARGRPGMSIWSIFVLGTLRVSLDIDYDRLQNLANHHTSIRKLLGHSEWDIYPRYGLTTIKDNIGLLTEEVLEQINVLIVQFGHQQLHPYSQKKKLNVRCDSFVAKTDVHFPSDIGLLYDALRKMVEITATACKNHGIAGMRQHKHNTGKLKSLKMQASKSKKKKTTQVIKQAHKAYIDYAKDLLVKNAKQQESLLNAGWFALEKPLIDKYCDYANLFIDQIDRRVLQDQVIPHEEKIFSIFEPHTEWVCKGKVGVPVELGIKLAVVQDQHQFILHHRVMEKEQDVDVAVVMAEAIKEHYGSIDSISFDRGFWSQSNEQQLQLLANQVILPKKGYISQKRSAVENEKQFKTLRHKHSAVESGIHDLQVHGLEKVPDSGIDHYRRYISSGIIAHNIHKIGTILKNKNDKRQRKKLAA